MRCRCRQCGAALRRARSPSCALVRADPRVLRAVVLYFLRCDACRRPVGVTTRCVVPRRVPPLYTAHHRRSALVPCHPSSRVPPPPCCCHVVQHSSSLRRAWRHHSRLPTTTAHPAGAPGSFLLCAWCVLHPCRWCATLYASLTPSSCLVGCPACPPARGARHHSDDVTCQRSRGVGHFILPTHPQLLC